MGYQKNDLVTVRIEDMGQNGEGIGKADGYTLFVKDTVIGDVIRAKVIKAKKNYRIRPADGDPDAVGKPRGAPLPDRPPVRRLPASDAGLPGTAPGIRKTR